MHSSNAGIAAIAAVTASGPTPFSASAPSMWSTSAVHLAGARRPAGAQVRNPGFQVHMWRIPGHGTLDALWRALGDIML